MYMVSKGGTFGTLHRSYRADDGAEMCIIKWGPLGWLSPVRRDDVLMLKSAYESEARAEAEQWHREGCPPRVAS